MRKPHLGGSWPPLRSSGRWRLQEDPEGSMRGDGTISTITGALGLVSPKGPATLIVSGDCRGNVLTDFASSR